MNLEKAIVIQTIHNNHNPDYTDQERQKAHDLSIEAMKREQQNRPFWLYPNAIRLPGETE